MKEPIATGGPAFPITLDQNFRQAIVGGMTLRDYFAAKALQGLLADPNSFDVKEDEDAADIYAEHAYAFADAMLEARKHKTYEAG